MVQVCDTEGVQGGYGFDTPSRVLTWQGADYRYGYEALPPSDAKAKVSGDSPRLVRHSVDGTGDGALNAREDPHAGPIIKSVRWIMPLVGLRPITGRKPHCLPLFQNTKSKFAVWIR